LGGSTQVPCSNWKGLGHDCGHLLSLSTSPVLQIGFRTHLPSCNTSVGLQTGGFGTHAYSMLNILKRIAEAVFNNSSATITFANGTCTSSASPLSITFNRNACKENAFTTHVKHLVVSIYLAFRSFWIIPNEIPSVSSHIAKYPMPGMAILGLTTLPPSVEIFLEKSSIEGTSIVFVTLPLVGNSSSQNICTCCD
jgi:hypothetical protein